MAKARIFMERLGNKIDWDALRQASSENHVNASILSAVRSITCVTDYPRRPQFWRRFANRNTPNCVQFSS